MEQGPEVNSDGVKDRSVVYCGGVEERMTAAAAKKC